MSIYRIIERLESISSRNEKMEILRGEVNNELLKQVFFAALNPHINYFIKKIPEKLPKAPKTLQSMEWALAELNALSARTVTGHAGIDHLARVLSSLNEDDADIIERVIKKDMDSIKSLLISGSFLLWFRTSLMVCVSMSLYVEKR